MAGVLVQKFNNRGDLKYYENITSAFNRSRLPSKIDGYLMVHRRLLFWQQKNK